MDYLVLKPESVDLPVQSLVNKINEIVSAVNNITSGTELGNSAEAEASGVEATPEACLFDAIKTWYTMNSCKKQDRGLEKLMSTVLNIYDSIGVLKITILLKSRKTTIKKTQKI
jgi:hypothetical protein